MAQLTVDVKHHRYPIFIDNTILSQAEFFKPYIQSTQVFVITNETVGGLYLSKLNSVLDNYEVSTYFMPDGEAYKSFDTFQSIIEALIKNGLRRNATIIALGGGVVGDMAGFSAACYQRGIPFIQVPTTLLAMVDSSVGGKTAINHPLAKNMVGAFYQPQAVVVDLDCLYTLPAREFAAGMAEVIKYGLIRDSEFLEYLEMQSTEILSKNSDALSNIVKVSCAIKAKIVELDETEQGLRGILNLGHTFGHAIEKAGAYEDFLHGEAVAIGTCMVMALAEDKGLITAEYFQRVCSLYRTYNLPTTIPKTFKISELLSTMRHDKKNQSSNITLVVPVGVGKVEITERFCESDIKQAIGSRMF
ncbi:3-dehydroquinate synthase [Pleionea sediminis]|uniref:3-dehydroquinate synthase n=1 Tax=Pleionea sediminis TaxID=2569479 RepID=UPI001184CB85|nr:3-dehydroquinate synthase [Pleionea sediminis]